MVAGDIKKLYYSIGEVCNMLGVEAHVLRYWESEFEQLSPRKNRAGRRVYTHEDYAVVRHIHELLRVHKYTLEGAKQVLCRDSTALVGQDESRTKLVQLRSFLENIARRLA